MYFYPGVMFRLIYSFTFGQEIQEMMMIKQLGVGTVTPVTESASLLSPRVGSQVDQKSHNILNCFKWKETSFIIKILY